MDKGVIPQDSNKTQEVMNNISNRKCVECKGPLSEPDTIPYTEGPIEDDDMLMCEECIS